MATPDVPLGFSFNTSDLDQMLQQFEQRLGGVMDRVGTSFGERLSQSLAESVQRIDLGSQLRRALQASLKNIKLDIPVEVAPTVQTTSGKAKARAQPVGEPEAGSRAARTDQDLVAEAQAMRELMTQFQSLTAAAEKATTALNRLGEAKPPASRQEPAPAAPALQEQTRAQAEAVAQEQARTQVTQEQVQALQKQMEAAKAAQASTARLTAQMQEYAAKVAAFQQEAEGPVPAWFPDAPDVAKVGEPLGEVGVAVGDAVKSLREVVSSAVRQQVQERPGDAPEQIASDVVSNLGRSFQEAAVAAEAALTAAQAEVKSNQDLAGSARGVQATLERQAAASGQVQQASQQATTSLESLAAQVHEYVMLASRIALAPEPPPMEGVGADPADLVIAKETPAARFEELQAVLQGVKVGAGEASKSLFQLVATLTGEALTSGITDPGEISQRVLENLGPLEQVLGGKIAPAANTAKAALDQMAEAEERAATGASRVARAVEAQAVATGLPVPPSATVPRVELEPGLLREFERIQQLVRTTESQMAEEPLPAAEAEARVDALTRVVDAFAGQLRAAGVEVTDLMQVLRRSTAVPADISRIYPPEIASQRLTRQQQRELAKEGDVAAAGVIQKNREELNRLFGVVSQPIAAEGFIRAMELVRANAAATAGAGGTRFTHEPFTTLQGAMELVGGFPGEIPGAPRLPAGKHPLRRAFRPLEGMTDEMLEMVGIGGGLTGADLGEARAAIAKALPEARQAILEGVSAQVYQSAAAAQEVLTQYPEVSSADIRAMAPKGQDAASKAESAAIRMTADAMDRYTEAIAVSPTGTVTPRVDPEQMTGLNELISRLTSRVSEGGEEFATRLRKGHERRQRQLDEYWEEMSRRAEGAGQVEGLSGARAEVRRAVSTQLYQRGLGGMRAAGVEQTKEGFAPIQGLSEEQRLQAEVLARQMNTVAENFSAYSREVVKGAAVQGELNEQERLLLTRLNQLRQKAGEAPLSEGQFTAMTRPGVAKEAFETSMGEVVRVIDTMVRGVGVRRDLEQIQPATVSPGAMEQIFQNMLRVAPTAAVRPDVEEVRGRMARDLALPDEFLRQWDEVALRMRESLRKAGEIPEVTPRHEDARFIEDLAQGRRKYANLEASALQNTGESAEQLKAKLDGLRQVFDTLSRMRVVTHGESPAPSPQDIEAQAQASRYAREVSERFGLGATGVKDVMGALETGIGAVSTKLAAVERAEAVTPKGVALDFGQWLQDQFGIAVQRIAPGVPAPTIYGGGHQPARPLTPDLMVRQLVEGVARFQPRQALPTDPAQMQQLGRYMEQATLFLTGARDYTTRFQGTIESKLGEYIQGFRLASPAALGQVQQLAQQPVFEQEIARERTQARAEAERITAERERAAVRTPTENVLAELTQAIQNLVRCCDAMHEVVGRLGAGGAPGGRPPTAFNALDAVNQLPTTALQALARLQQEQRQAVVDFARQSLQPVHPTGPAGVMGPLDPRQATAAAQAQFATTEKEARAIGQVVRAVREMEAAQAGARDATSATAGSMEAFSAQGQVVSQVLAGVSAQTRQAVAEFQRLQEIRRQQVLSPEQEQQFFETGAQALSGLEADLTRGQQRPGRASRMMNFLFGTEEGVGRTDARRMAEQVLGESSDVARQMREMGVAAGLQGGEGIAAGLSTAVTRIGRTAGSFLVRHLSFTASFGLINAFREIGRAGLEAEATFVRVSDALRQTGRETEGLRSGLTRISGELGVPFADLATTAASLVGVFDDVRSIEFATEVVGQLQLISKGALNAAEGFRSMQAIATAFGLQGSAGLRQVADVATVIQNTLSVNVEDTIEGLAGMSELAGELRINMETAAVAVAVMARGTGQTGTAAAEQFGRILQRFQTPQAQRVLIDAGVVDESTVRAGDYGEALLQLITRYDDLSSAQQRVVRTTVASDRQARAFAALVGQSDDVVRAYNETLNANGAAQERVNELLAEIQFQLQRMTQVITNIGVELIRSGLFEGLRAILGIATQLVGAFTNMVSMLNSFLEAIPGGEVVRDLSIGLVGVLGTMGLMNRVATELGVNLGAIFARIRAGSAANAAAVAVGGAAPVVAGPAITATHALRHPLRTGAALSAARAAEVPVQATTAARAIGGIGSVLGRVVLPVAAFTTAIIGLSRVLESGAKETEALARIFEGLPELSPEVEDIATPVNRAQEALLEFQKEHDSFWSFVRRIFRDTDVPRIVGQMEEGAYAGAGALPEARAEIATQAALVTAGMEGRDIAEVEGDREAFEQRIAEIQTSVREEGIIRLQSMKEIDGVWRDTIALTDEQAAQVGVYLQEVVDDVRRQTGERIRNLQMLAAIDELTAEQSKAVTSFVNFFESTASFRSTGFEDIIQLQLEGVVPEGSQFERAFRRLSEGTVGVFETRAAILSLQRTQLQADIVALSKEPPEDPAAAEEELRSRVAELAQAQSQLVQDMATHFESLSGLVGRFGGDARSQTGLLQNAIRTLTAAASNFKSDAPERVQLLTQVLDLQRQLIDVQLDPILGQLDVQAAFTVSGVGDARIALQRARVQLQALEAAPPGVVPPEELRDARIAVIEAQESEAEAVEQQIQAINQSRIATIEDPHARAQAELAEAERQLAAEQQRNAERLERYNEERRRAQAEIRARIRTGEVKEGDTFAEFEVGGATYRIDLAQPRDVEAALRDSNAALGSIASAVQGTLNVNVTNFPNFAAIFGALPGFGGGAAGAARSPLATGQQSLSAAEHAAERRRSQARAARGEESRLVGQAQRLTEEAVELADEARLRELEDALTQANQAVEDAAGAGADTAEQLRQAIAATEMARIRDPLLKAQLQLKEALRRVAYTRGRDALEYQQALQEEIAARQALADAILAQAQARLNLQVAIAQAAGREVDAARFQAQVAQSQLAYALAEYGPGTEAALNAEAQVISATAGIRDAMFNEAMDDIQFMLDMDEITADAAIRMLEDLLEAQEWTEAQRRQIMRTIKGLEDELAGEGGQWNIGDIRLPTPYEMRRAIEAGVYRNQERPDYARYHDNTMAGAYDSRQASNYQDNRSAVVYVSINGESVDKMTAAVANALGRDFSIASARVGTASKKVF